MDEIANPEIDFQKAVMDYLDDLRAAGIKLPYSAKLIKDLNYPVYPDFTPEELRAAQQQAPSINDEIKSIIKKHILGCYIEVPEYEVRYLRANGGEQRIDEMATHRMLHSLMDAIRSVIVIKKNASDSSGFEYQSRLVVMPFDEFNRLLNLLERDIEQQYELWPALLVD